MSFFFPSPFSLFLLLLPPFLLFSFFSPPPLLLSPFITFPHPLLPSFPSPPSHHPPKCLSSFVLFISLTCICRNTLKHTRPSRYDVVKQSLSELRVRYSLLFIRPLPFNSFPSSFSHNRIESALEVAEVSTKPSVNFGTVDVTNVRFTCLSYAK